ncbi:MAG: FtsL-like putative cell division protein [Chitinophagales bacterium]
MEEKNTSTPKKNLSGMLKTFDEVSIFKLENLINNIPYFLFVVVIGIFYIWNNHRGVEMERDSRVINQQLLEKQFYYNATKDSLTQHSRQSTVARMVDTLKMQELSNPPFTIKEKSGKH